MDDERIEMLQNMLNYNGMSDISIQVDHRCELASIDMMCDVTIFFCFVFSFSFFVFLFCKICDNTGILE